MAAWQGLLEELLRERRPALIGYAALLTGDRSEAEDLVHDAVRTFGRPRYFPSLNAADAYVRRAIASAYIDRVRSRRSWLIALPRLVAGAAAPDDAVGITVPVARRLADAHPHRRADADAVRDPDGDADATSA